MKIAFISNFLNHHQKPFCDELYSLCDEFRFVATERIPEERTKLGYDDMGEISSYVIRLYGDSYNEEIVKNILQSYDIIMFGSCPNSLIKYRHSIRKPYFIYTERLFKKGTWRRFVPSVYLKVRQRFLKKRSTFLPRVLCASAFASRDISLINPNYVFYKWGYFPEFYETDIKELVKMKKSTGKIKILWLGRFIDWKRPFDILSVAVMLKKEKIDFELTLVGTGKLFNKIEKFIERNHLEKNVHLIGSVKFNLVREIMLDSQIFAITSDFNEGWGVVLNEAMNSCCAIVASHAVGAVPYLLEHEKNGLIYKSGDIFQLFCHIKNLKENPEIRFKMGLEAYNTLHNMWNPKIAANRLIKISQEYLNGSVNFYSDTGPCSRADKMVNNWYE
ncbi:MAG: glycosyltransferase family 4 protein [Erysipelothrix sp.]|nr:glycosyltransferase family 4 protein [Erysipelothrix sp.]